MAEKVGVPIKLAEVDQKKLNQQKRAARVTNERFFRCHPELRSMVSAFLANLLVEKPDDIPAYAAQFFTDPQLARKLGYVGWSRPETPVDEIEDRPLTPGEFGDFIAPEEPDAATTGESAQELEEILVNLFKEADQDGNGVLDAAEFMQLMETADLGLKKQELHMLLAEVDENSDGQISYAEFVPLAVEVVQMIRLKASVDDVEAYAMDELRAAADYSAPSHEKLAAAVMGAASPDGTISRSVLKQALGSASLGLNKQVVAIVAKAAVPGGSADAATVAEDVREHLLTAIAQVLGMQNLDFVGEELQKVFAHVDKDGAGLIEPKAMKDLISRTYKYLSRMQLNTIVAEAPLDENGQVLWEQYLPRLSMMVKAMMDPSTIAERQEMAARAEFLPVQLMNGREQAQMEEMLSGLFAEHDADGNGFLDRREFETCLFNADLGFSKSEVDLLLDMFDANSDGMMSYTEFATLAYDVLVHAAREKAIVENYMMG